MKNILLIAFGLISFFCSGQDIKNVDASTFKKLIDENKSVIIDLRTPQEIQKKGMIKNAIQIDYFAQDAAEKIGKLDRNKSYLIYCAGGGRSTECSETMQKMGFKHIVNLEKGFDDWKAKGFEIVKN